MTRDELIEALSDKTHESWARWMSHLFRISPQQEDGSVLIHPHHVKRWWQQIETPYDQLSEQEKQSDRKEVERLLPIIDEYTTS